jgi:hypothetical protein
MPTLDDRVARDLDHNCEGLGSHRVWVKVEAVADLPPVSGASASSPSTTTAMARIMSRSTVALGSAIPMWSPAFIPGA